MVIGDGVNSEQEMGTKHVPLCLPFPVRGSWTGFLSHKRDLALT